MNTIAKVVFPLSEGICSERELYFRDKGGLYYSEDSIKFLQESELSLFTYFNSLSFTKLAKYAGIKEIIFSLRIKGKVKIKIKAAILDMQPSVDIERDLYYANYRTIVLFEGLLESNGEQSVEINVDLSKLGGDGLIYPEMEAEQGTEIFDLEYLSNVPARRQSKIGIVFCTYRREKFVIENVSRINKMLAEDDYLQNRFGVFVIDNGKTLKKEDIEGAFLFPNANTGGSGGFTRGIKEVCSRKEYTHFLLMDDDIKFEPEVLRRILFWTEFCISPDRLTIGGTMLIAEDPVFQYEMGAIWTGKFNKANKFGYNVKNKNELVRNEFELNTEYNAWWCCCMPVSTVSRIGLPLQFFIKGDDIEYSLRAKNDVLLTNGIAVWHESFSSKYSSELEYYIKRNELIINSVHRRNFGRLREIFKLVKSVAKQLVFHRYEPIKQIFLAYDHFLKGADYFKNIDAESLHKELREGAIKQYSKNELLNMGYDIEGRYFYKSNGRKKSYIHHAITLNGYLIGKNRYPQDEKSSFRFINMISATPRSMYKALCTVHYNPAASKGFVTYLDKNKLISAFFGILKRSVIMMFSYGRVSKSYRKLVEEL